MDKATIKTDFINKLPKELMDKLPKIYDAIIDEGVEGILSGKVIYNGKVPETPEEWYIALGHYFVTASTAFRGTIEGVREYYATEPVNINVNYRNETHSFHFDPIEQEKQ